MRRGCILFASFAAGVFFALYLLPLSAWLWTGLALAGVAGVARWRRWRVLPLIALGAAVALCWTAGFRAVFYAPWESLDSRRTEVTFTLAETPQPVEDFAARGVVYLRGEGVVPTKALFYGDRALLNCHLGDEITVRSDVSLANRFYGEETAVYTSKGIFLRLTARGDMSVTPVQRLPLYLLPAYWGEKLSASIQTIFPSDVAPFLAALTVGDRSALDQALTTDLSRTGISHLVSLSGMHICFLAEILSLAVGYEPRRRAAVCIPALLFFALAVGASASVLRAVVLYAVLLLAPVLGRQSDRWTSLSFALALLLFLDPYAAQSISLQLSFAAAAGLTLITEPLQERLAAHLPVGDTPRRRLLRRLLRPVMNISSATLGALSLTLPLSMSYFGSVSLVQPLTNLLILPVVPLLFALTLLAALFGMVLPIPAALCAKVLAFPARYILWIVSCFAKLPLSSVTVTDVYYPLLVLGIYLLCALLLRAKAPRRWWVYLLSAGVLFLAAWGFTASTFRVGDLTAAVLSVGQGQSVLLMSRGETALVDCGGNGLTSAGDVAADYLQDRGESTLDYLILTHYHSDHTNGLPDLFRRVKINHLILPRMDEDEDTQQWLLTQAAEQGSAVTWIDVNTGLTFGECSLRLYAPLGDGGANEEGLSLLASAGDFDLLITGDMNAAVENLLVEYGDLPSHVEVLLAGHHGSRYATGDTLLNAIRPDAAIISVGRNTYGHPADATLDRLRERGVTLYRTDTQGTITVTARQE